VKKVLLIGGGLFVILGLLGVVAFTLMILSLDDRAEQGIERIGSEVTGVTVSVAGVEVAPFAGATKISGLTVNNPPGFSQAKAFECSRISADVGLVSMLLPIGPLEIEEMTIEGASLLLELTPGGTNLGAIVANARRGSASRPEAQRRRRRFVIGRLSIRSTRLTLRASALGQSIDGQIELPDIELRDIGRGGGARAFEVARLVFSELESQARRAARPEGGPSPAAQALEAVGRAAGQALESLFGRQEPP